MTNPNPISYIGKRSIIAIAGGAVGVSIILAVFLFNPLTSISSDGDVQIPASISENLDVPETRSEESSQLPFVETGENPVIAEVNGEEIHLDELNQVQTTIQTQSGQTIPSDVLLEQLITKEVLLQEAANRDISVTRQEAESSLQQQIAQNGLSVDQFKQRLQAQGASYDNTVDLYQDQITVDKLLADELSTTELSVSGGEAELFFDENIEAIKNQLGDQVVFEDVSDLIKNTILQQKQKDVVTKFVNQLKSDSEIIKYNDVL